MWTLCVLIIIANWLHLDISRKSWLHWVHLKSDQKKKKWLSNDSKRLARKPRASNGKGAERKGRKCWVWQGLGLLFLGFFWAAVFVLFPSTHAHARAPVHAWLGCFALCLCRVRLPQVVIICYAFLSRWVNTSCLASVSRETVAAWVSGIKANRIRTSRVVVPAPTRRGKPH